MNARSQITLLWITALVGLIACIVVGACALTGTTLYEQWLNADTVEMQMCPDYNVGLGSDIRLWRRRPPRCRAHENRLISYLLDKGYWVPRQGSDLSWVHVATNRSYWLGDGWSCILNPLESELLSRDEEWREWSDRHPSLAVVLWPKILREFRAGGDESGILRLLDDARQAGQDQDRSAPQPPPEPRPR